MGSDSGVRTGERRSTQYARSIGVAAQASSAASSVRLGHRPLAGEVLAHVGRRAAVRPARGPRAAARAGLAAGDARDAGGTRRARRARAARRPAPTSATSRTAARWKSIACSRCPNAVGCWGATTCTQPQRPERGRPRSACSPVSAASRSRPNAAAETPDGIGASSSSLRRAISRSWSAAVAKKPPCSGSAKRSRIWSASARAATNQRGVERRLVERQQRLEQERVVLEVGGELGPPAVVGAQQAAVGVAQVAQDELGRGRRAASRVVGRARARRRRRPARRSSARSRRSGACRRAPGHTRSLARGAQAAP